MTNLSVSPCSNPKLPLAEVLARYSELGFTKMEGFTAWAISAFNWRCDPEPYKPMLKHHNMSLSSFHLPPVTADHFEHSVQEAIKATRFAAQLGAPIVLFKAHDRHIYVRAAPMFLDGIADTGVTPVLQNHSGSAISTLEDYREVIEGINDPRMKTLLEVGHFHAEGISWREGYDLLGDSIALVHLKDMVGDISVPFGTGEIDLPGLLSHMNKVGYTGDYVVEMEVRDADNTLQYLREAREFLLKQEGIRA